MALPFALGIAPFGIVTGVALVAAGITPAQAMGLSLVVYAGAATLAAAQLLGAEAPMAVVLLTVFFINLRFMMYSASLRQHLSGLPLRWKLLAGYLLADNSFGIAVSRFSEHPELRGKLGFYLGVAGVLWLAWQLAVGLGVAIGAGLPASWRLDFAAPLAFIAMTVPFLRERAMVAAAIAAAVTVIALSAAPARLGIAAAALVGIAVGLLVQGKP